MLAESEKDYDHEKLTDHQRDVALGWQTALITVIAALEQADSAPRLEWEVRMRKEDGAPLFASASDGRYDAEVRVQRHYVTVAVWHKSVSRYMESFAPDDGVDINLGQRIAELVIHRHRGLLDEIARVK